MGRHLRLVRHPEGASNHSAPLSGKQNPKSSASVRFKACERGRRFRSEREQPFVVNLVTRKATNDEQLFRLHLSENVVRFHVRTWEDICGLSAIQREQATILRRYLENKTLNLLPAFDLKLANVAED